MIDVMQKVRDEAAEAAAPESQDAAPQSVAPETEPAPGVAPASESAPATAPETEAGAGEATQVRFAPEAVDASAPLVVGDGVNPWRADKVDQAIVAFHDRYSAICEQYRSVRARLLSMKTASVPRLIAITSSVPQEGKSVTTINLGLVMAEGGEHSVLVVDADFRRTSVDRLLGVEKRPGLAEVLRGDAQLADTVYDTPLPNLKLLPAGDSGGEGYAALLSGASTRMTLSRLRASFDYVLIDTPPVNTVSDVSLLAPHCDGVIMVIEMRRTPEPTVQQAVRTLQTNNVKILGCLLSRFRDGRAGYYDRYYSYYRNE